MLLLLLALPAGLLSDLEALDRELATAQKVLQQIDHERATLDDAIATLQAERADVSLHLAAAKLTLRRRLYRWQRLPPRALLLAKPAALRERLATSQIVRWAARHDRRAHDAIKASDHLLATLEHELQTKRQRHAELFQAAQTQRTVTANARANKRTWHDRAAPQAALLSQETERAQRELLDRLGTRPGNGLGARLPIPVRGRIAVPYGRTRDARSPTWTSQHGISFAATFGDSVYAVGPGVIVYAGWVAGYGHAVVIDHGRGEHSIYAQLGRMDVAEGHAIAVGDILGTVGDSGAFPEPTLYFELRKLGRAIDPTPRLVPGRPD